MERENAKCHEFKPKELVLCLVPFALEFCLIGFGFFFFSFFYIYVLQS